MAEQQHYGSEAQHQSGEGSHPAPPPASSAYDAPPAEHRGDGGGERHAGGGGGGGGGGGERPRGERRGPPAVDHLFSVKVDNLSYETTEADLKATFGHYGQVEDVRGFFGPPPPFLAPPLR